MKNVLNGYTLNIEPHEVVDRDIYVETLNNILSDMSSSNIVILKAQSAIGKSALVSKVLNEITSKQKIIRIKTLPINTSDKIDEWEYFKLIFERVNVVFNTYNLSFENYINSFKNKANNKMVLSYIVDHIFENVSQKHIIFPLIYLFASFYFKIGKFDVNRLIEDNSIQSRRIKYQYICYIFSQHKLVLSIDNIQNIDKHSLQDLLNLVNETQDNTTKYIFEYTISELNTDECCDIMANTFATTSISTKVFEVEKLDKSFIVDAVSRHMITPNSNWEFSKDLQEEYEKTNSGNIREMLDYSLHYSKTLERKNNDSQFTLNNILQLPDCAKLLLSFVINANGIISFNILNEIAKNIQLDVQEAKSVLLENLVIEEKDDCYYLSHASLADVWLKNAHLFEIFDNISFKELKKIYLHQISICEKNNQSYNQAWLNLILLYSKYEPNSLTKLFKYIDDDYNKSISPQNAWRYINQMLSVTKEQVMDYRELYFEFIRFCFENELYVEGYSIVEFLLTNDTVDNRSFLILHKAMYLSALDRHEANIAFSEEQLKYCTLHSKEYYNLKLILLSSYRSLHRLEECYKIHKEFLADRTLKNNREWGLFLRLCEMYLDRNISLKYLRKSVYFFEKRGETFQAGKSLISYSYILATQGKLKKALRKINLAQTYLKGKRMGNHMFLVNKAAIRLYSGDFSESVWELLNESEISTVVSFDKLAIIVNKLVWCIENENTERYHLLINAANELLKVEPDHHIHGLVYYNIYYLLKKKNAPNYKVYLQKAEDNKEFCKPIKARLDNTPTPETRFALTKPWHVCFLAYWTFDL